jgi:hypothetical protein
MIRIIGTTLRASTSPPTPPRPPPRWAPPTPSLPCPWRPRSPPGSCYMPIYGRFDRTGRTRTVYAALPAKTNRDRLDVLAWWKAARRATTTSQRTRRAAAQRIFRTWPRWRASSSVARRPRPASNVYVLQGRQAARRHEERAAGRHPRALAVRRCQRRVRRQGRERRPGWRERRPGRVGRGREQAEPVNWLSNQLRLAQ